MFLYLFELLPVALACVAAVLCARSYSRERRRDHRLTLLIGVVCSVILVIAQTSWFTSYIVLGSNEGAAFANVLWTIFNSLVMFCFIAAARTPKK
jgi:Na+/phosphate symporter